MPNRLIHETSPYLLQHAHNPVDWYPWGEEALQRAREEERPIMVSIGYSSCHWCHVMERESYEDPHTAALMNDLFVNVKVDREERPDLDNIFMDAVQVLTGHGGWPLNIFLTPEGKPFFGGTYFPPSDRIGMPSWTRVLKAVAEAYRNRRWEVDRTADQLVTHIRKATPQFQSAEPLTPDILRQAYQGLSEAFDPEDGGLGRAPKFPQPMAQEYLLRYHLRTGDQWALQMVEKTLSAMAQGGIYDQIGGGFHRYSTDSQWLVPHFEKMLCDNALLARLYLHTFQVTGNPFYRRIVEETLDYVLREMASPEGGFYSAQDADSEGEEGKFYLWTPTEILQVLGKRDGTLICHLFGVSEEGNFEGRSILYMPHDPETVASAVGLTPDELAQTVYRARTALRLAREKRIAPQRDDKILVAWNSMMVRSFAEAAIILQRDDYRQAASTCANFLLRSLRREGRLLRTYRAGQTRLKGYLEDYALLTDALLAVYEMTFDPRWLRVAQARAAEMVDLFWDEGPGVFFDTGRDHEELILRPREVFDNAVPCGGSVAAELLLKLATLAGAEELRHNATVSLRSVRELMARSPLGAGHWLCVLDIYLSGPQEIVVIGPRESSATEALLRQVYKTYRPTAIIAGCAPEALDTVQDLPLFEAREMLDGQPTVYVCENYACLLPVTTPEALAVQLAG